MCCVTVIWYQRHSTLQSLRSSSLRFVRFGSHSHWIKNLTHIFSVNIYRTDSSVYWNISVFHSISRHITMDCGISRHITVYHIVYRDILPCVVWYIAIWRSHHPSLTQVTPMTPPFKDGREAKWYAVLFFIFFNHFCGKICIFTPKK